jgi:hypothetical protein
MIATASDVCVFERLTLLGLAVRVTTAAGFTLTSTGTITLRPFTGATVRLLPTVSPAAGTLGMPSSADGTVDTINVPGVMPLVVLSLK